MFSFVNTCIIIFNVAIKYKNVTNSVYLYSYQTNITQDENN